MAHTAPRRGGHSASTPRKLPSVAPAKDYRTASGKEIIAGEIDCWCGPSPWASCTRHDGHLRGNHRHRGGHSRHPRQYGRRGGEREAVRFGHPSGTLRVGAEARQIGGQWTVTKAVMSCSARILMEGWVRCRGCTF